MNKYKLKLVAVSALSFLIMLSYGPSRALESITIKYGCSVNPEDQVIKSRALAKSISNQDDLQWRTKGDLHRKYHFPDADMDIPYRLYVPVSWDGNSQLPMVLFLHGAGSDENRYIDANDRQLICLAEKYGFILVYKEVDADHGGMIPLVLPDIFNFFKEHSKRDN